MDTNEIENLRGLVHTHKRRLQILKQQAALYGKLYCPPHVQLEIEDTQVQITAIQHDLNVLQQYATVRLNRSSIVLPKIQSNFQPPRRLRIFLCHASDDKPAVRELYFQLRSDGIHPWFDEEDILPGQDWQEEISKAVRTADIVLVCLSPKSVTKQGYIQIEVEYALNVAEQQPKDIIFAIPFRIQECPIPERLQRWHCVNLFEENGYERLMRALRKRARGLSLTLPGAAVVAHKAHVQPQTAHVSPHQHPSPECLPQVNLQHAQMANIPPLPFAKERQAIFSGFKGAVAMLSPLALNKLMKFMLAFVALELATFGIYILLQSLHNSLTLPMEPPQDPSTMIINPLIIPRSTSNPMRTSIPTSTPHPANPTSTTIPTRTPRPASSIKPPALDCALLSPIGQVFANGALSTPGVPPATPLSQPGVISQSASLQINARSGPQRTAKVVATVTAGEQIIVTGFTDNAENERWLRLTLVDHQVEMVWIISALDGNSTVQLAGITPLNNCLFIPYEKVVQP